MVCCLLAMAFLVLPGVSVADVSPRSFVQADEKPDKKSGDAKKKAAGKKTPAKKSEPTAAEKKAAARKKALEEGRKRNKDAPVVALKGATIVTQAKAGTIENGTIVFKGDMIEAIGADVKIPDGAKTYDVSGMTITPGLIDVRSTLWMTARSAAQTSTSGSMNAADGVDPFAEDWADVARHGVTAVYVQPGSNGTLGGRGVVLKVGPGSSVDDLMIKADAGIQASLGLTSRNSSDRYRASDSLKKIFDGVKKYQDSWTKYEADLKKYKESLKKKDSGKTDEKKTSAKKPEEKKPATPPTGSGRGRTGSRLPPGVRVVVGPDGQRRIVRVPPGSTPTPAKDDAKKEEPKKTDSKTATKTDTKKTELKEPKKPTKDPVKDVLVKVLTKEIPLRLELHKADDATNALKVAKDLKINVVFEGVSHLNGSWDKVRESMTPLVVGPIVELETVPAYRRNRPTNWMEDVNVAANRIAIGSFTTNPRGSRFLRTNAAAAVSHGMDPEIALQAITSNAAKVVGLGDSAGSLEVGHRSDIAVFAGDPLDPAVGVRMTIAGGTITHDDASVTVTEMPALTEASGIPSKLPKRYAIKSTRVLMPNGKLKATTIVVANGVIKRMGDAADDIPVFDVGESVVTPGLVNGHFVAAADDRSIADAAHVIAVDSFDPSATALDKLVEAGFTSLALAPGSANVLAGQVGCVRIDALKSVAPHTIAGKFVLAAGSRSTARFPSTLSGQVRLLDGFLNGEPSENNLYVPKVIQKAFLQQRQDHVEALKGGEQIALIEATDDAEIRSALKMIERHQLKANLLDAEEFEPYIDELVRLKVGLVARPITISDYDWYAADLAKASNAGVKISFGSGSGEQIRRTVAMVVNAGMKPNAALNSLTSDAAAMCGLKKSGRLKPKQPADIVIWNGSPLDLRARPIRVIVDGEVKEAK